MQLLRLLTTPVPRRAATALWLAGSMAFASAQGEAPVAGTAPPAAAAAPALAASAAVPAVSPDHQEERIPQAAWVMTPLPAGATLVAGSTTLTLPAASDTAAGATSRMPGATARVGQDGDLPAPGAAPDGDAGSTLSSPPSALLTQVGAAPLPRGGVAPTSDLPRALAQGRSVPGAQLPPELARELKRRGVDAENVMLYVQAIDAASPLLAMNEERSVTLASTTKLLTSMAALDVLGGQFRWQTKAYALGKIHDGVLQGDLLVVGGGDPELDAAALIDWMGQWRQRGLRRIEGNLLVDRRAFNVADRDHSDTPEPTPLNPHHAWPDALMVNEGRITLYIESDARGEPAFTADLLPEGVFVKSELESLPAGRSCRQVRRPPSLEVETQGEVVMLRVQGQWARDCERRRIEVLALPGDEHAKRSLHAAWLRAGGELAGKVIDVPERQRAPRGRPWHVRTSPTLATVLLDVNKWSNNIKARQVFLSLSPKFPARAASLTAARQVFREWLDRQGLSEADESAIAVDNGSGLSRQERGAARVMAELLRRAWSSPQAKPMLASLPLVGRDGTMALRLHGSDVEGHAFIKTGTLSGVRAIAGYVQARSGAVYAIVSVIQNAGGSAQGALDRIIAWVHDEH